VLNITRAYTRKVKTTRRVVLLLSEEVYILVEYKLLPKDRNFIFDAKYNAALNTIVNAKSLKVIYIQNYSDGVITIPKYYYIGKIVES